LYRNTHPKHLSTSVINIDKAIAKVILILMKSLAPDEWITSSWIDTIKFCESLPLKYSDISNEKAVYWKIFSKRAGLGINSAEIIYRPAYLAALALSAPTLKFIQETYIMDEINIPSLFEIETTQNLLMDLIEKQKMQMSNQMQSVPQKLNELLPIYQPDIDHRRIQKSLTKILENKRLEKLNELISNNKRNIDLQNQKEYDNANRLYLQNKVGRKPTKPDPSNILDKHYSRQHFAARAYLHVNTRSEFGNTDQEIVDNLAMTTGLSPLAPAICKRCAKNIKSSTDDH
jgi:hypothetical protein